MQVPTDIGDTRGGFRQLYWNADERRVRTPLRFVALLLTVLLTALAYGVIVGVFESATDPSPLLTALFGEVGLVLVLILATLYVVVFIDKRPLGDIGLQFDSSWWRDVLFGLALGAVMALVVVLVPLFLDAATVSETMVTRDGQLLAGMSLPVGITLGLILFVLLAGFEELLFRGYLLVNTAEGVRGPLGAKRAVLVGLAVSAIVFALAHAMNPGATLGSTLVIGFFGLLLGSAYVYTERLAIPIGLHVTWNFTLGQVFGVPVSGILAGSTLAVVEFDAPDPVTGGEFGPEGGLLALLALTVGALALWLWLRHLGVQSISVAVAEPDRREY